jgi:hypothetical protein
MQKYAKHFIHITSYPELSSRNRLQLASGIAALEVKKV